MSRGNAKQGERGALGSTAALFTVAKGVDTAAEGEGKALLGEAGEPAEGDDVVAAGDVAADDPLALFAGDGAGEVAVCQLSWFIDHWSVLGGASTAAVLVWWQIAR